MAIADGTHGGIRGKKRRYKHLLSELQALQNFLSSCCLCCLTILNHQSQSSILHIHRRKGTSTQLGWHWEPCLCLCKAVGVKVWVTLTLVLIFAQLQSKRQSSTMSWCKGALGCCKLRVPAAAAGPLLSLRREWSLDALIPFLFHGPPAFIK